jgi:hypothetical protein
MTCDEVKNHLLDFHDKTLDTPTMTRIATHLISCPPCAAEADGLADCIEQVATLPTVEVPIGFAQRVMAHVREIEKKPSLWQDWLLPLSRKLPLQVTALVLVSFIGLLLYQREEELTLNQASQKVTAVPPVQTATTPSETAPAAAVQKATQSKLAANLPVPAAQQIEPAAPRKSAPAPTNAQNLSDKKEAEARSEENPIARRRPIQVQEASSSRESGRFLGDTWGFSPVSPFGGIRQAAPRSLAPAREGFYIPMGERVADHEFVVRRRPVQRHDQDASSRSLKKSTEADGELRVAAPDPAAPAVSAVPKIEHIAEIRFYNVAPEHYEFFKQELAAEAIIESEAHPTSKENLPTDRQLLIKVTILPPALPESAPSSR